MNVISIDLGPIRFDQDSCRHLARVTIQMQTAGGEDFDVGFSCHTSQPRDCPSTLVLYGLIKHASDQARLLPAFRGPDNPLDFDLGKVAITAA